MGAQAVVDNQMSNEQYEHSEVMYKTKLMTPEVVMKVFVSYPDKKNKYTIPWPAVIMDVNTMPDAAPHPLREPLGGPLRGPLGGSVDIHVRYLDGLTNDSLVALEDVFERDDTVSYENWTLHNYDPRTMDADGQTLVTTGSSPGPSTGAASGAGGADPSMGAASDGGAGKKRKSPDAATGKQPMKHDMGGALDDDRHVENHNLFLVFEARFNATAERATAAEARATAAENRATAAEMRAIAAEARTAALQQQMETAEAEATRAPRTRTCTRSKDDFKGMGSGK